MKKIDAIVRTSQLGSILGGDEVEAFVFVMTESPQRGKSREKGANPSTRATKPQRGQWGKSCERGIRARPDVLLLMSQ